MLSLTGSATLTVAEIVADRINLAVVGNTPRHQASVIFQATPQVSTERFSIGAVFMGATRCSAPDTNVLRMPGYVTTTAFVQVRATDRVSVLVNATNLFDVLAINTIDEDRIPTSGILRGLVLNGRAISGAVRFDF